MLEIFVFICICAIIFSISALWYFSFKVKDQQELYKLQILSLQDKINHLENELNNQQIDRLEFKEDFNYYCDNLGIFD